MSQKTKVGKDHCGLFITAGGYIARPFFGTSFKEDDEVKSHHFGGSIYAGVGLLETAKFRKKNTFEYWVTTGCGLWQKNHPNEWKMGEKKYKGWDEYISQCTLWYRLHANPAQLFAEPHNKKYARMHGRKYHSKKLRVLGEKLMNIKARMLKNMSNKGEVE